MPTFNTNAIPDRPRRPAHLSFEVKAQSSAITTALTGTSLASVNLSMARPKLSLSPVQFAIKTSIPSEKKIGIARRIKQFFHEFYLDF